MRLLVDDGFDRILPQGGHTGYVWLAAGSDRVEHVAPWLDPSAIVERLSIEAERAGLDGVDLVGLGNCHGVGEKWRDVMKRTADHAR